MKHTKEERAIMRSHYANTPGKRPGIRFLSYKGEWWAVDATTLTPLHAERFDSRDAAREWVRIWKQDPQSAYDWVGPYLHPKERADAQAEAREHNRTVIAHLLAGGCPLCGAEDHDEDGHFEWPTVYRRKVPYFVKKVGAYEARVRGDGPPGGPFFYHWAVYRGHRSLETVTAGLKPLDTLRDAQKAAEEALEDLKTHAPN